MFSIHTDVASYVREPSLIRFQLFIINFVTYWVVQKQRTSLQAYFPQNTVTLNITKTMRTKRTKQQDCTKTKQTLI